MFRATGWFQAGHWVVSGTGVVIRWANEERRYAGIQHPLHICGEALAFIMVLRPV